MTLDNGKTINLENYQLPQTWIWLLITFVTGVAWMLYWTAPKRTVTNLAVTSQIPINTDGMDYGLITKRDHRNMNWFAVVTAALQRQDGHRPEGVHHHHQPAVRAGDAGTARPADDGDARHQHRPGGTTKLTLAMRDRVWETEHLLQIGELQLEVAGNLVFDDADGARNLAEVQAIMQPQFK